MALWKQILLSLVVLLAAIAGWAKFFPGSQEILARNGLGWVSSAVGAAPPAASGGREQANARPREGGPAGAPRTAVVTAPVQQATINDRLVAIGTGAANQTVTVMPFASGRLTEFVVASGASVTAGDVIARLDAEAEQIASDRAQVALDDARSRLERVRTLRSSNTATIVQVTEAELAVRNAELALRDAQLTLERRAITAPIGGTVGILPLNSGNYVTTQTPVATIDDRTEIVVDFWVPERFAGMIRVGTPLSAALVSRPSDVFEGTVSAIDNRVDDKSRTLRVQARIPNGQDVLRAGMAFRVEMRFPGENYPSVDPLAVQWGTDGAFVWAVRDGKAERTMVRIVQRNTESVLVDAPLTVGEEVVTQGIHAVRQGAPVMVARDSTQPAMPIAIPPQASTSSGT